MFEHTEVNGVGARLLPPTDTFVSTEVLEIRDPKNGAEPTAAPRTQYGVIEGVLVERYLPPETVGAAWSHDPVAAPWWEVVGHPPHGGLVADYNKASGGAYRRKLDPANNIVAYAQNGEAVTMAAGTYKVVRKADSAELVKPTIQALRAAYYS
ncbi:MAG: hypothetical protein QM709_12770 [Spongiibacteraceae bacterium]